MDEPVSLGIDAGSISLEACLLDASGRILASCVTVVQGNTKLALIETLENVLSSRPDAVVGSACATGSGRGMIAAVLGCASVNEITAHALGTATVMPDGATASIVEIGGQDSKFIQVRKEGGSVDVLDHAMNTLCAAGTGSFFDGLAKHLGLTTEELARIAEKAASSVHVAGRCAVFSRSDLIHLCQKGAAIEDIALGICHAAARNVAGTVIRNRPIHDPFYFTGGVAANRGMVRALGELFGLREGLPIVPENHRIFGAMGAAIHARESGGRPAVALRRIVESIERPPRLAPSKKACKAPPEKSLPPGAPPPGDGGVPVLDRHLDAICRDPCSAWVPRTGASGRDGKLYAGLDVGSTSIKWAIIDGAGDVVDHWYSLTRGNPALALEDAVGSLRSSAALRSAERGEIGLGITGSGRKFASALLGCRLTVNEVTAMVQSARLLGPQIDTIFEIGGQDAKFVRLCGERVEDFALNIACSAGTGSLIVDESARFELDIAAFDELALESRSPAPIHSRCNVFMDSDLVFHMQSGRPLEDIAAGLMRAVASNYIEKVVEKRKTGSLIALLGGVSRLGSMVRFLEEITGKKIEAPWWGFISGAIGAARHAMRSAAGKASGAVRIDEIEMPRLGDRPAQMSCSGCPSGCTIMKIEVTGRGRAGRRFLYTGDGCGRYDALNRGKETAPPIPGGPEDLFTRRLEACGMGEAAPVAGKEDIGVPRAQQFFEIAPFVKTLLGSLHLPWGYSRPSNPAAIRRGEQLAPAQHCLPVKVAIAHGESLAGQGVSSIFLPEILRLHLYGRPLLPCVYTQQLASFTKAALDAPLERAGVRILSPKIYLERERRDDSCRQLSAALERFGIGPGRVRKAFDEALEAYVDFKSDISTSGMDMVRGASRDRPAVVLFGRPYSVYDPALNLQVARRLQRLGVGVVPYDTIAGYFPSGCDDGSIPWLVGEEQVRAAKVVRAFPHVYPLGITYYGCGVDAFLCKHLHDICGGDKPYLSIEFDGHGAEAGLETRLEAFVDQITSGPVKRSSSAVPRRSRDIPLDRDTPEGVVVGLPHFAPHAYAFAGTFERVGLTVDIMPEPTEEIRLLGERHSSGRECNPFFYLLGDLLSWASKHQGNGGRVFFVPNSSRSSCLISQYGSAFEQALRFTGNEDVTVWAIKGPLIMSFFSIEELKQLWMGLLGIDYLFRLAASMRPYEARRGEVMGTFRQGLGTIRTGIREGRTAESIGEAAQRLRDTAVRAGDGSPERLKIGVIGDIYTRVNSFANQGLYDVLESMGCEVLAPPFLVDLLLYDMAMDPIKLWREGSVKEGVARGVLSVYQWAVWNYIRSMFPLDPKIQRDGNLLYGPGTLWQRESARYLNVEQEGLLAQNLGKAFDHIRNGADGIINVMCHGCMIGTSTEAVMRQVSDRHDSIPVLSLSYDSLGDVHTRTRLEAFVELSRSWRRRRRAL